MGQYNISGKLHTEILEEEFGKIDVQVLSDDNNIREVLLTDELSIARTYALTIKSKEWQQNEEICFVNTAIQRGEAIGRAFKSKGYAVHKNVLDVYITILPEWLQIAFATESKKAKTRIMEFLVQKGDKIYNYGIVTEIYSPFFRKPVVNAIDEIQINIPSRSLLKFRFGEKETWTSLHHKALASNLAKQHSPVINEVKERVHEIIMESLPLLVL